MNKQILFVTSNQKKLAEARAITGIDFASFEADIPEIQSLDVVEVAKAKALAAYKIAGQAVIVDDTGMSIEALSGLPGAFITWFLQTLKADGILELIAGKTDRRTSVTTCIAYADADGVQTFTGTVHGRLADTPRGDIGFGYDPIFIPDGHEKTFAEMSSEEKNLVSMRGIALRKFKEFAEGNNLI